MLFSHLATALVLAAATTAWAEIPSVGADTPGSPLVKGTELTITEADYRQALLSLPPPQRQKIEQDPMALQEFLLQLYAEQRMVREAQVLGLLDKPDIQAALATARRQVLVNAVVNEFKASLQQPDLVELAKEYYLTHRAEFIQPERIRAAHILVQVQCPCEDEADQKRKQAEAILTELRQGGDFSKLAQERSEDQATVKHGGVMLPWLSRGMLVQPFEEVAFALEPGAISDVVKTTYGYHIIKVLAHQPETILSFEQVQDRIIKKLADEYQASAYEEYVSRFFPADDQFDRVAIGALFKAASPPPSAPPAVQPAAKATP